MKDTKFIELLNLYLDHEITADETAQLEAEISGNPQRYRAYQDYCRMQKACTVLAEQTGAMAPKQSRIVPITRRRRLVNVYFGAGLAAAACVAVLVLNRPFAGIPSPGRAPRNLQVVRNPTGSDEQSKAPALAVKADKLYTVFTAQALAQTEGISDGRAAFNGTGSARFEWMNQVQLDPVSLQPMIFRNAPDQTGGKHTFHSSRPFDATVQMTAFQFQR